MNPFLNQQNSMMNNNLINPNLNQLNLIQNEMNPFLHQMNSALDTNQMMMNNPMMVNNNQMMMNNPMMMRYNQMMVNNPMMMNNNQMMVNNPMIVNNNQMMMNNPMIVNNNQMMMNNPMMMNNNQMMVNNPTIVNNNQMMMNNPMMMNINKNNNNLVESNDEVHLNYENLNAEQKKLINQIINFYQENGCTKMNLLNINQINQLIKQLYLCSITNESDIIIDLFYYIKIEKKIIIFVNSDFKLFKVKIPTFITKSDLYSIAQKYKVFISTNILLIHNYKILNKDESAIEEISNNDFVFIIENRLYPDKSSYIFLKNKYPIFDLINIIIHFFNGQEKVYCLNRKTTIQELLNMVIEYNGLFESDCIFDYNGQKLNKNEYMKINLTNNSKIICYNTKLIPFYYFGKILIGETMIKNKKIDVKIGALNGIKFLFTQLESQISDITIKTIIIGNVRLKPESDNCLFLYGIKENFNFICEIENK